MSDRPDIRAGANPFKMPTDEEVFVLRDEEKRQKTIERERLKYKRVHEKTTWSARIGSAKTKTVIDGETAADSKADFRHSTGNMSSTPGAGASGTALPTVDVRDKDNMAVYIAKKREMGLIRMSLATKRQEIKKLDEEVERAEKRIRLQEEQLKETDGKFEAFLKHSDMEQVEAMKRAETETKAKQEKMQEIKKLSSQIAQIETDLKKNEEQKNLCLEFKSFLDQLTPPQWFRETLITIWVENQKKELAAELEAQLQESAIDGISEADEQERRGQLLQQLEAKSREITEEITEQVEGMMKDGSVDELKRHLDELDPDLVPMYFTDPDKILTKFREIEEGNLFLIQTCQELEEQIEDVNSKYAQEEQDMMQIAQKRRAQMETVNQKIVIEESKLRTLQDRIDRTTDRSGGGPTQEEIKEKIETKIKVIFRTLGLGDDSNTETLGMLTSIEMRLEAMRQQIMSPESGIAKAFVQAEMRERDKYRRNQARQIALNKQREERELRSRNALIRSQAPVKRRVGKPVMWRSRPLDEKKQDTGPQEDTGKDEDEEFFQ